MYAKGFVTTVVLLQPHRSTCPSAAVGHRDATATATTATIDGAAAVALTDACCVTHFIFRQ